MKERKKKRQALTNRKTATAQARMKTISNLANDQPPAKRRKKGNEGGYKDVRTGSISADLPHILLNQCFQRMTLVPTMTTGRSIGKL
jgi:mRNA-degrading endonuclease YafQ of YafQ-DinJ toxin-antitoxin module